jgi:hypothetical protein
MGKSNNRKDMHDYADDYDDYGDYRDTGSGVGRNDLDADSDMGSDAAPASTAIKAKMSSRPTKLVGMGPGQRSQQAKQRSKRSNQTDR